MSNWNPRYTAYACSHGLSETAMLEADRAKYPGGCMAGYIIWVSNKASEFRRMTNTPIIADHDAFTRFCEVP